MIKKIEMTNLELFYILNNYISGILVGFKDPSKGISLPEIAESSRLSSKNLINKGILFTSQSGEILLNKELKDLFEILGNPTHSVLISIEKKKSSTMVISYHYSGDRVISLSTMDSENYVMTEISQNKTIAEMITDLIGDISNKNEGTSFRIRASRIDKIHTNTDLALHSTPLNVPKDIEISGSLYKVFLSAIIEPELSCSFIVYRDRSNGERMKTLGFSMIGNKHSQWMLEPLNDHGDNVLVSQASMGSLQEKITKLLP